MTLSLVVVHGFGPHGPGDTISDEAAMRAILNGEHVTRVVRVERPPAPPAIVPPAQQEG